MNINDKPYTPLSIAKDNLKFRIPLYQRPYAWERDQTLSLLKDLYAQFDKDQSNHYYIGILNIARTVDDESRFDLIDGQQRVTTLILIGKVAIKYHGPWKPFLDSDRLDLFGRVGDKAFLNGDKAFLENNEKLEFNKKMKDTLEEVENFFKELKDQDKEGFSKFIYKKAAFFLAEVPSTYSLIDKNRHFVRMNNRGKQLEKHEILKVKLLNPKSIPDKKRDHYLEIWNDMVECLSGSRADQSDSQSLEEILALNENKNGGQSSDKEIFYTSICTIPEFLLIALARHLNKGVSPDKDKLLATFTSSEDTKLKDEENINSFMDVIEKQLIILKNFFLFCDKNDNYVFRIQNKNSKSIKNGDGDEDEDDEDKIFKLPESRDETKNHLIAVQSYLYVSTEPHHWLRPAFDWCQNENKPIDVNKFIKKLESIDNTLIREKRNLGDLPKEDDMTYGKINHYWFYRLDYELWKRNQNKNGDSENIWEQFRKEANKNNRILKLLEDFRFRRCGSIEHINPQKPQEGNSTPDHAFGNLALISSSRNSKFGNTPAQGKKELIVGTAESGYTESLKMLHFLYSNQNVEEQGKFMYKILSNVVNEASGRKPAGASTGNDVPEPPAKTPTPP